MISPSLFRALYDPVAARNSHFWHQKSHEDLEYFQKYWGVFCVPARDHLQKVSWTCGETSKSTYPCSVKAISQTSNTSFSVFRKSWELRLRWWIDRGSKFVMYWCWTRLETLIGLGSKAQEKSKVRDLFTVSVRVENSSIAFSRGIV